MTLQGFTNLLFPRVVTPPLIAPAPPAAMTLCLLGDDALGVILEGLCNPLEPIDAVGFGSVSHRLRALTQALRDQLRADHEVASALCRKVGLRSCEELREARVVSLYKTGLTTADLKLLFTLGSALPALEKSILHESSEEACPEGVQRLVAGLGAGALPAVVDLSLGMHVGDAGALALAAALGRGALPRLEALTLCYNAIGDAGLVALAPALRRLPALEELCLEGNPFGDEGLATLVTPPQPAGALTKLKELSLSHTQVSDAGCAALASALDSGAMPALWGVYLDGTPASAAAKAAVCEALAYTAALRYTRLPLPLLQRAAHLVNDNEALGSGTLPFTALRQQ